MVMGWHVLLAKTPTWLASLPSIKGAVRLDHAQEGMLCYE